MKMKYEFYEDGIKQEIYDAFKDTVAMFTGHPSVYYTVPWYDFINPLVAEVTNGYYVIHGAESDYDNSLDVIPAYNTEEFDLNEGMADWSYDVFSCLSVAKQEECYEWFAEKIIPWCDSLLFMPVGDDIRVYSVKHLKRVYYEWMNIKLGRFAKAHGGASRCAPLKSFYIYMAKNGRRVYRGIPKTVHGLLRDCGGPNNHERLVILRERFIDYINEKWGGVDKLEPYWQRKVLSVNL